MAADLGLLGLLPMLKSESLHSQSDRVSGREAEDTDGQGTKTGGVKEA